MIRFDCDPPLPAKPIPGGFAQCICLMNGELEIGRARWHASSQTPGTVQILELEVAPAHRRTGFGRRLLRGVYEQAGSYCLASGSPLVRLWASVGHKTQVIGRAFLTSEGYHHVGSAGNLFGEQDQLIYVKALA